MRNISDELLPRFTMNGSIEVIDYYFNNSNMILSRQYSAELLEEVLEQVKKKIALSYAYTTTLLYKALDKYPITGHKTAIMGSVHPAYEMIAFDYGAFPTVVEYANLTINHPIIKSILFKDFTTSSEEYDSMLSISTFEHDGLGRYGDPINPDGDIQAMRISKEKIKKDGLLFLAVPNHERDKLYWNAHRVYGPNRLPVLLSGWEVVEKFGEEGTGDTPFLQPIWVLRNTK